MSIKKNLDKWIAEIESDGMCDISDNQVIALIRGYSALEDKCEALRVQLELSVAAERAWERTMMYACGEDGPKSVADKFSELKAKCAALAAENAGLNKFIDDDCYVYGPHDVEPVDAAIEKPQTPAADAYLAEVRAQGVEMFARSLRGEAEITKACTFKPVQQFEEFAVRADECAEKLRQEAK